MPPGNSRRGSSLTGTRSGRSPSASRSGNGCTDLIFAFAARCPKHAFAAPQAVVVGAVPMTAPAASSACTVTYGPTVAGGSAIAVSNPLLATCATGVRLVAVGPANTLQAATSVAPFQLA